MKEEKRVLRVRQLLQRAKEKEDEWKNLLVAAMEEAKRLRNYRIDLRDYTIYEISRGGP